MKQQTVLIIEDERSLSEVLTYNLVKEGFRVVTAADGQDGLRKAQTVAPDLVVLDLMLPVIDGLQVCRQLRGDSRTQHIRILMLTARSEEVDEIVGFNMGADDYVTKPFKLKPLIHRIKALVRRAPTPLPPPNESKCMGSTSIACITPAGSTVRNSRSLRRSFDCSGRSFASRAGPTAAMS